MTHVKRNLSVVALAVIFTAPVFAKAVANAVRTSAVTASGTFLMPLTDGGATTLAFSGKGKHLISYSAECSTTALWASIQIIVDGTALAPTAGVDDAFCSPGDNSWVTAHYRVQTPALALGTHTVQIEVTAVSSGTVRLDDASLLVEK